MIELALHRFIYFVEQTTGNVKTTLSSQAKSHRPLWQRASSVLKFASTRHIQITAFIITAFIISIGILAPGSFAQQSGTIGSSLTIQSRLTLLKTVSLEFGQVRPGPCGGTVIVATDNERTATECAQLAAINSGLHSRGELTVFGVPGAMFTMSVADGFALHDTRFEPIPGVTDLVVTNLTTFSVTRNLGDGPNGVIGAGGTDEVWVGGTLLVPVGAKNGKYEGEVVLTIQY